MGLVFVANVAQQFHSHRACKQKSDPQHWQQLQTSDVAQNKLIAKSVLMALEPEKEKHKLHEEIVKNSLGGKLLGNVTINAPYQDKPKLLTDQPYVLPDSAAFDKDGYIQLVTKSHTLGSLLRKSMNIIGFITAKGHLKSNSLDLSKVLSIQRVAKV